MADDDGNNISISHNGLGVSRPWRMKMAVVVAGTIQTRTSPPTPLSFPACSLDRRRLCKLVVERWTSSGSAKMILCCLIKNLGLNDPDEKGDKLKMPHGTPSCCLVAALC